MHRFHEVVATKWLHMTFNLCVVPFQFAAIVITEPVALKIGRSSPATGLPNISRMPYQRARTSMSATGLPWNVRYWIAEQNSAKVKSLCRPLVGQSGPLRNVFNNIATLISISYAILTYWPQGNWMHFTRISYFQVKFSIGWGIFWEIALE